MCGQWQCCYGIFLNTVLTEHHLPYLLQETVDARAKWYYIGLSLDLPSSTLDVLREDMDTAIGRYTEVIMQWLKLGEATMKKLIEALESNTVKERHLASSLRVKYAKRMALQEGIVVIRTAGWLPMYYRAQLHIGYTTPTRWFSGYTPRVAQPE